MEYSRRKVEKGKGNYIGRQSKAYLTGGLLRTFENAKDSYLIELSEVEVEDYL